jgi:hypothetical protein
MTFFDYFTGPFRRDLARVIAALPPLHEFPKGEIVVQPRTISLSNPLIRAWTHEHRFLFASGLFSIVLLDQAMYTFHRPHYPRFRRLTMYPKWRGDCISACSYHIDPSQIFGAIGVRAGSPRSLCSLPTNALPNDFWPTVQREVEAFIASQLPDIDGAEFWQRCWREVPSTLKWGFGIPGRDACLTED